MNSGPLLFLGLFVTMVCSWMSFIMGPQLQLGDMSSTTNTANGQTYPNPTPGTVHQGAEVYRANGCAACHTQQVRPQGLGSDINHGWGVRRSTAYDYLFQEPVLLGSQRVGPDLANAGKRMNFDSVLLRLYEPRAIVSGSVMPPYPYLFEVRKIHGEPSTNALPLSGSFAPAAGYEVVPKPEAMALAAYVMGLHQDGFLYEAPAPLQPKAATNTPAKPAATNSPVK
jgi:cytochrome c oxidase cbb3-type subunit 2